MSVLRWTPEQYAAHSARRGVGQPDPVLAKPKAAAKAPAAGREATSADAKVLRAAAATKRFQALGRLPKGTMNKTEAAFAELLEERKRTGSVLWWKFHVIKVRLADNTFYEVDFLVMHADHTLWIYETKGEWTTDKGQMKIKVCAETLPVVGIIKAIKLPKKAGGGWKLEEYSA